MTHQSPTEFAADPLLDEMRALWKESEEIWDARESQSEFGGFVSADYVEVYQALFDLRDRVSTVLEWGSGTVNSPMAWAAIETASSSKFFSAVVPSSRTRKRS